MVVNCLNIRLDVATDRIGGTVVVGQKEHEWLTQTRFNHAAERLPIDVNPGPASRIIDLVIATAADLHALKLSLGSLGYEHRGNRGIDDREAFQSPENLPCHHLYACVQNSVALQNHIAVRDYLRTHPSEAAVYSKLKKQLAQQFPTERERYVEGKTDFILSILEQCGFSTAMAKSIRRANQR